MTERHPPKLEEVKGDDNGRFLPVLGLHRNLPVALAEVYFGENCAAVEAVREIQHVRQRINIWLGNEVQPPAVSTRPP
jgi:hypothetical protein